MQIAQKNFYKKLLGRAGEVEASKFLKKLGYQILEMNFHTHVGEADIIAMDGKTVVFVEVKTRSTDNFGAPSEAVSWKKQEKYFKVATEYLIKKGYSNRQARFDVVEIENGKINHIKDAFCM